MTSPIDNLLKSLDEIAICLKSAHNNNCSESELKELMDVYNQYYFALQLLASHQEIPVKFTRLSNSKNGKIIYKQSQLDKHIRTINKTYKLKGQLRLLKKELKEELEKSA